MKILEHEAILLVEGEATLIVEDEAILFKANKTFFFGGGLRGFFESCSAIRVTETFPSGQLVENFPSDRKFSVCP